MDADRLIKQSKWQAYIDDALLKTEQVTEAAIYGVDGVKWAASKNLIVRLFTMRTEQACSGMENPSALAGPWYTFTQLVV
jgi:hypothetical protein